MKDRTAAFFGIGCLVFTLLWIVFMIWDAAPTTSFDQALAHAAAGGLRFRLIYINAALITFFATAFMAGLYGPCKTISPTWARAALLFVPVYAAFNFFAYLSQLLIVPRLLSLYRDSRFTGMAEFWLRQFLQAWPESAVAAVNGLAYALLGIPSIVFGWLLYKNRSSARIGGILLAANGVACIAGTVGNAASIPWLVTSGSLSGGVLFLASLPFLIRHLLALS